MARDEAAPFPRGSTWYGGGTIDSNDLGGVNLEGKEFVFEVNAPDSTTTDDTSGRLVRCRVVRNKSGVALKGARLAHYQAADPYGTKIDGYCYAIGDRPAGVIDEFLPSAGVPNNDLFYLVVEGPTLFTLAGSSPATTAIGSTLVPVAGGAASVTDNLGGRVALQDLTGSAATLGNNIQNVIGYAGAVASTANATLKGVVRRGLR